MAHAPAHAYLAIGSNLGDRGRACYAAVAALSTHPEIKITAISQLIETAPVGLPEFSSPFLNGAIAIETTLTPKALMQECLAIEEKLGRHRSGKWESRSLDLDLLLYGDKIISSDDLIVPHPLMHQRRFVLEPLAEIAPDAHHPMTQMSVRGMLDMLG
jgi:2-amino-4-hydroxy-6-hydroxymethyldihydropteridine diphosphokinase